jgi:hypothetical protein
MTTKLAALDELKQSSSTKPSTAIFKGFAR